MFSFARVVVLGCVLAMGNCLYAQGEPLYFSAVSPWEKEQETLPRRMQVSVSAALVHNVLRDRDGAVVSRYMYGGQAEGFVHLGQNVEIGVTGSRFTGAGMKTQVLSEIRYQMAGGLLKWTLSPQTASEVYILVGAGYARERMRFAVVAREQCKQGMVFFGGAGLQIPLWHKLYINADWRVRVQQHVWDNFVLEGSRLCNSVSAGINYIF